jgi:hypothetical protein
MTEKPDITILSPDDKTHIDIRYFTRERLKRLGNKGESYDKIINDLIDYFIAHPERGKGGKE